jgi:hypothetical protein
MEGAKPLDCLERNEIVRSGDSSLARAFESKHGHLQLRGSSRSSMDEPGQ